MSEVSKIDLSRIKITNVGGGKFKMNQILLPKTNIPSSVKSGGVIVPKTNLPILFKANELTTQSSNSKDTVKTDELVNKETSTTDIVKTDELVNKETNTTDTVKTEEVVENKINKLDIVKTKTEEVVENKINKLDIVKTKTEEVVDKEINIADTVKAEELDTEKTSFSGEQKNLAESTKEIQELLAPLKAIYPTNSEYEKQVFVNKFREEIRRNSDIREVVIAGGIELIKIICQPYDIPIHMGKKWLETAKRNH